MEDRINLHQLMELKAAFERADTDQGGSLDMEEFLEAFGGVLGENLTTTQLIHLFMKIDANSDGSVDWDEFTQFMLLENQAAADMSDRSFAVRYMEQDPRLCDPNPKSVHHRDMIEQILLIGKGTQQEKLVTSARDGTVRVWLCTTAPLSHPCPRSPGGGSPPHGLARPPPWPQSRAAATTPRTRTRRALGRKRTMAARTRSSRTARALSSTSRRFSRGPQGVPCTRPRRCIA